MQRPGELDVFGDLQVFIKLNTVPERSMTCGRRQQMRPGNETEKQMMYFLKITLRHFTHILLERPFMMDGKEDED